MRNNLDQQHYPTRKGIAIPACELHLPVIEPVNLIPEHEPEVSNHHDCWSAKKFGAQILFKTLRNLDICQSVIPNQTHDYIHIAYEQPRLPRPFQAYAHIMSAAEDGSLLRTGTATKPEYETISDELIREITKNYKWLR